MTTDLAVRQPALAVFQPTPEQTKMIRDTFANGAPEGEFRVLMEIAKARNLNPLLRQVWFVKRWDSQKRCEVWAVQVSIDGLRAIADRTGKYDGQDEPEFEEKDGAIKLCRVKVYRKDVVRAFVGTAYWSEYAATTKEGKLTQMWANKPHIMLAKCAEALAFRKAFPEDSAGLYVAEEMPETLDVTPVAVKTAQQEKAESRGKAIMAKAAALMPEPPPPVEASFQIGVKPGDAKKPWPAIQILFAAAGYENAREVAERVKVITGKEHSKDLTAEDVAKVETALLPREPPEPGAGG